MKRASVDPAFTPDEFAKLIMSVGRSHARRLSPVTVGRLLRREVDRGVTTERLAEELSLAPGTSVITWFLRLGDLPEEIQGLVQFGRQTSGLSLTQAAEIARLSPDAKAMRWLATQTIELRFTATETRSVIQIMKRRSIGVDTAVAEVLRGRPTVDRLHLLVGIVSPLISAALSDKDDAAKQELMQKVARTLGLSVENAYLAANLYSLILRDEEVRRLGRSGIGAEQLEERINAVLAGTLS